MDSVDIRQHIKSSAADIDTASSRADNEYDEDDDEEEKDSYELSFEEEQDIIDDDNTDNASEEEKPRTAEHEQMRSSTFQQVSYITKSDRVTTRTIATIENSMVKAGDGDSSAVSCTDSDVDQKSTVASKAPILTAYKNIVSNQKQNIDVSEEEEEKTSNDEYGEENDEFNEYMDLSFLESTSDVDDVATSKGFRRGRSLGKSVDDKNPLEKSENKIVTKTNVPDKKLDIPLVAGSSAGRAAGTASSSSENSESDDDDDDEPAKKVDTYLRTTLANIIPSKSIDFVKTEGFSKAAAAVSDSNQDAALERSTDVCSEISSCENDDDEADSSADEHKQKQQPNLATLSATSINSSVSTLARSPAEEVLLKTENIQKMFSKSAAVAAPEHTGDEDDNQINFMAALQLRKTPSSTTTDKQQHEAARLIALTAKTSVRHQQLQEEASVDAVSIVESEATTVASGGEAEEKKPAVPLHAVKSKRVSRPGAPDSAQSSRATTATSTSERASKLKSTTREAASGGGDLYRQFKKLENQYKSLHTRIQSGIKHLHTQVPEEIDELDLYNRGLYDKRESDRAQRLTLLERLKVALAQATTAIERLHAAPSDLRAKDAAKTTLCSLSQELNSAREMYRGLDALLVDQAKTNCNELKQCEQRLGTYIKRIASDLTQQQQCAAAPGGKKTVHKEQRTNVNEIENNQNGKNSAAVAGRHPPPALATSKSILLSAESEKISVQRPSIDTNVYERLAGGKVTSVATSGAQSANNDKVLQPSNLNKNNNKSRIQTHITKGDLPDAVFEYRTFIEQNGGRNGRGWTELEHKAYLSARIKQRAFAVPVAAGGGADDGEDAEALASATPINDERFYSDLAKELMIKTTQQVREHDAWYAQLLRLDVAQKAAVKDKKDAKREQREQKQRALKEQQARQRVFAQKHREQALRKWHDQTRQQVEQWKVKKTMQEKQKQDEQKFAQLVQKERQMKTRQQHDYIKQKVLMYRQQREQMMEAERAAREQQENELRKQRAWQANRFLKLSAKKSIQTVQQQRQQSKTVVEQRKAEHEERLKKLRSKVTVKAERDPQRLLEKTTAWKRRTGTAEEDTVGDGKTIGKKLHAKKPGGGGGSSEAGAGDASNMSSSDDDDDDDDSDEDDDDDDDDKSKSPVKEKSAPPITATSKTTAKQTKSASSIPKKKPFVAGGIAKKSSIKLS